MDERIQQLVAQIKKHMIKMYGENIKKVILYGSYVRDASFVKCETN